MSHQDQSQSVIRNPNNR